MVKARSFKAAASSKRGARTRNWYAWNNLQPPKPYSFHIHGEVQVGNPGVMPILVRHTPQGVNPSIILLDLILVQTPGLWPSVVVWKHVRYDEPVAGNGYSQAQILSGGSVIKSVPVQDIH